MKITPPQSIQNSSPLKQISSTDSSKFITEIDNSLIANRGPDNSGIQITLSDRSIRASSTEFPGWVQEKSTDLRNNPDQIEAMNFVQSMATTPGGALISNGPNSDGINDVYYAATGLPVTPDSKARHEALTQSITANTTAIFEAERSKGTPAADIFDKIQTYMSRQPKDYLEAIEWHRSSYARF